MTPRVALREARRIVEDYELNRLNWEDAFAQLQSTFEEAGCQPMLEWDRRNRGDR